MKRPAPLPYPDLPDSKAVPSNVFWRAAWLRDLAELQALERLTQRAVFSKESLPLRCAIYGAIGAEEREVRESFKHLVEAGGLLYAWVPDAKGGAA
jgi:hypothetical protein